jgi:hypothetical protein
MIRTHKAKLMKFPAVALAAVVLFPALAMAGESSKAEPVKLDDAALEQVSGGDGSLLNLPANINIILKDISVVVNVSNVPINAGVAAQVNLLGSAEQTASVTALQSVTQLQTIAPLGSASLPGGL